jgi:hypothetical protein
MDGRGAKRIFSKEVLSVCERLVAKVGIRILQRNVVKYTVPVASIFVGTDWNYLSTRAVGWVAVKHLKHRLEGVPPTEGEPAQPNPRPDVPPAAWAEAHGQEQ